MKQASSWDHQKKLPYAFKHAFHWFGRQQIPSVEKGFGCPFFNGPSKLKSHDKR